MSKRKRLKINTNRCMGCCACEIACKMENDLPRGVRFIVMRQEEEERTPYQRLQFSFDYCHQCQDPACMTVCPAGAIYKRADGIVMVREESCIGCRACGEACPWQIPQFYQRPSGGTVMRKCTLCASRTDQGLAPSCVIACPAGAIEMEDINIEY